MFPNRELPIFSCSFLFIGFKYSSWLFDNNTLKKKALHQYWQPVTCSAKGQPLPLSGDLNFSMCFGLRDENHNEFSKSITDQLVNIKN